MIIRSKAPLRLGLAGGGTDVSPYCDEYGGCILNATIDMYAHCTLEANVDNVLFYAADKEEFFISKCKEYYEYDGQLDLHKGVYNRIVKEFNNNKPLPIKITTYCDAPPGSGLGSSSTLVVAIIKAFVEMLNLPLGEYDIARLAYEIERKDIGLNGGKQDQYAATFGGFNFIEFYSNDKVIVNPLRVKNWILNELESSIILYFTGISRESAKIIDEQSKNTKMKRNNTIEAMHELKSDAFLIKEAVLKGDIKNFAKYFGKSWEAKKRTATSITNTYIDDIYSSALKAGAYAGKVSGAGGGGFMMLLVNPIKRHEVINILNRYDGKVMNFHFIKNGTQAWTIYDSSMNVAK